MNPEPSLQAYRDRLDQWLDSCRRAGKLSKNSIAVGFVILDHLHKACPLSREAAFAAGGELRGARSGLAIVLTKNDIPTTFLKEVTSRQASHDAERLLELLNWGHGLAEVTAEARAAILSGLAAVLVEEAKILLNRENLHPPIHRHASPVHWIAEILLAAEGRSRGIVEQHLVGAKLERRFPALLIPNNPAHAADRQTARNGDFELGALVFHVTANPTRAVIEKCGANVRDGLRPLLIVPNSQKTRAQILAEEAALHHALTILALEDFLALNIIELAGEHNRDFYGVFADIIAIYNRRLTAVETELSLTIELP